jgi:hypothetical protein
VWLNFLGDVPLHLEEWWPERHPYLNHKVNGAYRWSMADDGWCIHLHCYSDATNEEILSVLAHEIRANESVSTYMRGGI